MGSLVYAQYDSELNQIFDPDHAGSWEDLRFPASGINLAGSAAPPTVDNATYPGTLLFADNLVNLIAGAAQMPHSWSSGSPVRPHVHWAKTTGGAGGVVWEWCYAVVAPGDVTPAYSAWLPATAVIATQDTAERHSVDMFPLLGMSGKPVSTMILWQVRRNVAAGGDIYAANARLLEFDIHYRVSKKGTYSEAPDEV